MPVPSAITELSTTASANYPAGTENANTTDDYLRTYASYIADLRDRFVNVVDYPGADLGAKLQAAYDARLAIVMAGDGLGAGIGIIIPPNPDGEHWVLSTAVDLSSGGYVHLMGIGNPYIELGADLTYMIKLGVTNKSNRCLIENITFKPGAYTATSALLIGGGTGIVVNNVGFQKSVGDVGSFTDGILLDRSQDPTAAGVTFSEFSVIQDSGGSACTNSMIKARGLVSSVIRNVRVGYATTYGVYLDSTPGDVQSNLIEHIQGEPGVGTSTALVYINANTNPVTLNEIRSLSGNNLTDYGIQCAGAASIEQNRFVVDDNGYATSGFDDGGTAVNNLNLVRESVAFTPTWAAASVNPALGNGTLVGKYIRDGKTVTITYTLVAGSTTTFGTGQYTFSLPSHLPAAATYDWYGAARAVDSSAGSPFIQGTSIVNAGGTVVTADFPAGLWSPTIPMTWVSTDQMAITITYGI